MKEIKMVSDKVHNRRVFALSSVVRGVKQASPWK
jgi:hypothetical protein